MLVRFMECCSDTNYGSSSTDAPETHSNNETKKHACYMRGGQTGAMARTYLHIGGSIQQHTSWTSHTDITR